MEFNPEAHEHFVNRRLLEVQKSAARVVLFDEAIDRHHKGDCTFDQAIEQYLRNIDHEGVGYTTNPSPNPLKAAPQDLL